MEIGFNPLSAAIAGTSRAQSSQSNSQPTSFAGGVAEHQKIHDNAEVSTDNRTEDRDADGRQLLDYSPHHDKQDGSSDDQKFSQSHAKAHHPPSLNPNLGHFLDFDA
jgi:hypothetical protein